MWSEIGKQMSQNKKDLLISNSLAQHVLQTYEFLLLLVCLSCLSILQFEMTVFPWPVYHKNNYTHEQTLSICIAENTVTFYASNNITNIRKDKF